jgi:prophage antirepressor-like protein
MTTEQATGPQTALASLFAEKKIRIRDTVADPLICGVDLASYIGDANYGRTFKAYTDAMHIQHLPTADAQGRQREMLYLTEAGAYKYLLQSRLAKAEPFQLYVYSLLKDARQAEVDVTQLKAKIARSEAEALRTETNEERARATAERARATAAEARALLSEHELAKRRAEDAGLPNAAEYEDFSRRHGLTRFDLACMGYDAPPRRRTSED